MSEGWTSRWKALLIWASGYFSFIAFAIVGGYTIVKSENEELKKTAKKAFIVSLIFMLISMFFTVYSSIGGLSSGYYSSGAYTVYNVLQMLVNIAKIVVYVVLASISFFKVKYVQEIPEKDKEENAADGEVKF